MGSVESYKTWAHENGLDFVEHDDFSLNFAAHFGSVSTFLQPGFAPRTLQNEVDFILNTV